MSGEPKDDRPWEPSETLTMTTPHLNQEDLALHDQEVLAALTPQAKDPELPPIGEGPLDPGANQADEISAPPVPGSNGQDEANVEAVARVEPPGLEEISLISPPEVPRTRETVTAPPPAALARRTAQTPPAQTRFDSLEKDARQFVRSYLSTAEQHLPSKEAAYYAEHVSYFKHGRVSRRFVEADQRNYYRRWPKRDYTLVSAPEIVEIGLSDVVVQFRINYAVRNGAKIARGITRNRVRLKQTESTFRITSIQEYHER